LFFNFWAKLNLCEAPPGPLGRAANFKILYPPRLGRRKLQLTTTKKKNKSFSWILEFFKDILFFLYFNFLFEFPIFYCKEF
jgi:hypothetical protein